MVQSGRDWTSCIVLYYLLNTLFRLLQFGYGRSGTHEPVSGFSA